MEQNAIIFDGNSLYARSFWAAYTDKANIPQTLTYAVNTVLRLLNPYTNGLGYQFDKILFCWDGAQKPDKGRKEKPTDYHPTKEILQDIFTLMLGAAHATHPYYEADDVVATATMHSKDRVLVISGDKDLMQLVINERIHYYCLNNKAVLSTAFINQRWHIKRPSQISVALAIIGDPVDNIQGIRGWGPKKVQRLFEDITPDMDFGSVVQAIDAKIPEEHKASFYESLERTLLNSDVPGVPEPAPLVLIDPKEVAEMGLSSLQGAYREVYHIYNVEPF